MKIETRKINIEIDVDEWQKIYKEVEDLKYNKKLDYKTFPFIHELFENINTVYKNKEHKIDRKLGTF